MLAYGASVSSTRYTTSAARIFWEIINSTICSWLSRLLPYLQVASFSLSLYSRSHCRVGGSKVTEADHSSRRGAVNPGKLRHVLPTCILVEECVILDRRSPPLTSSQRPSACMYCWCHLLWPSSAEVASWWCMRMDENILSVSSDISFSFFVRERLQINIVHDYAETRFIWNQFILCWQ